MEIEEKSLEEYKISHAKTFLEQGDRYHETLKVSEVACKLKGVVSEKYQWPDEVGEGYHLEFILHPDGTLILDFLNQESAIFWSEAKSVDMQTPFTDDGEPITCEDLKQVGIPFMS